MSNGRNISSDGSGGDRQKSLRDTTGASDPLLDAVVQQTLSGNYRLAAEELADLQAIAARYSGQALQLEPVGVELVECLLQRRLPTLKSSAPLTRDMAETIARTLFDHPEFRSRLEDMWRQLGDSVTR